MEIRQQYLERYLYDIAVDQLMADYQAKGYQVAKEEKVGGFQADLVATKGDEVVVVEVKTGTMTPQRRRQVAAIGDYVRTQKNYKFLVVLANTPKPKRIDIPNIEQLLSDYLIENFPQDLNRLSPHTRIIDVAEATVDEVTVTEDGGIVAKGNGTVEAELQYGSGDDGASSYDSFPLTFEVTLKHNKKQELFIADAETIEVDTSSFYE